MIHYALARIARTAVTLFGVSLVAFFLVRLSGNPAGLMLGPEASAEDVARLTAALGLDRPLLAQFGEFVGGLVRGDIGNSYSRGTSAIGVVLERLPNTLRLALASFGLAVSVAMVLVLVSVRYQLDWLRSAIVWFGSVRQAIPSFWLGLVLVIAFSVQMRWLPSMGAGDGWRSFVLPVATIATLELALYARLFDQGFYEQLGQDYVRTARAKGVPRTRILVKHVLPNALLPAITVAGLNLGSLLGGILVIEIVFNWPGIAQLLLDAVYSRDYPLVQALILVIAGFFVLVNLVVDLLYGVFDPRTRVRVLA